MPKKSLLALVVPLLGLLAPHSAAGKSTGFVFGFPELGPEPASFIFSSGDYVYYGLTNFADPHRGPRLAYPIAAMPQLKDDPFGGAMSGGGLYTVYSAKKKLYVHCPNAQGTVKLASIYQGGLVSKQQEPQYLAPVANSYQLLEPPQDAGWDLDHPVFYGLADTGTNLSRKMLAIWGYNGRKKDSHNNGYFADYAVKYGPVNYQVGAKAIAPNGFLRVRDVHIDDAGSIEISLEQIPEASGISQLTTIKIFDTPIINVNCLPGSKTARVTTSWSHPHNSADASGKSESETFCFSPGKDHGNEIHGYSTAIEPQFHAFHNPCDLAATH